MLNVFYTVYPKGIKNIQEKVDAEGLKKIHYLDETQRIHKKEHWDISSLFQKRTCDPTLHRS